MNDLNGLCGRVPKKVVVIVMAAGIVLLLVYHISSSTPLSFYDSESMTSSQEEQRFPQAIIIGVKKGGTRALISMLDSHPQVESARGEVHFFDRNETFRKGLRWYVHQMPFTAPNEIAIEKSPSYFIAPYVPHRLYSMSPSTKVILIVRDPIERTISDYIQLFNPDRIGKQRSFDDVVLDGPNHINDRAQVIRSRYIL
jgi:[heparan sulfate]-glucosamine 3-sulfotransferase 1